MYMSECARNCNYCLSPGTCTEWGCRSGFILDRINKTCIGKLRMTEISRGYHIASFISRTIRAEKAVPGPQTAYVNVLDGIRMTVLDNASIVVCAVHSPCNLNMMQCNNGTCKVTSSPPYFKCVTCPAGYTGRQCERRKPIKLFLFFLIDNSLRIRGLELIF